MKKALFCIVILLVCLSFLPAETRAAGIEKLILVANSDNASYTVKSCESSAEGVLVIPTSYNGYPITNIGDFAFSNCTGLTGVVIPEGIRSIGMGAFSGCTELTEISVPNSITTVGVYAFDGCTKLAYTTYENAKYLGNESNPHALLTGAVSADISACTIHKDTRSIGFQAFKDCVKLTKITLPDNVTTIGNFAFDGCSGLTHVNLGAAIVTVGEAAFQNCTGLTQIALPDGVTEIGWIVFSGCTGLTEIAIPDTVTTMDRQAFDGCTALKKVIFDGDCDQWKALTARGGNTALKGAEILTKAHCFEWVVTEEATCTSEGTKTFICSGCGAEKGETQKIPFAEHSYGAWTEVKAPTVEETGTEERKCVHCDAKQQREVAKLEAIPTEPTTEPTEPSAAPTEPTGIHEENPPRKHSGIWAALVGVIVVLAAGAVILLRKRNHRK